MTDLRIVVTDDFFISVREGKRMADEEAFRCVREQWIAMLYGWA